MNQATSIYNFRKYLDSKIDSIGIYFTKDTLIDIRNEFDKEFGITTSDIGSQSKETFNIKDNDLTPDHKLND